MNRTRLGLGLGTLLVAAVAIVPIVSALPGKTVVSAEVEGPPDAAYVAAYVHGCHPVEYDFAGAQQPLDEAAARIHDEIYLGAYKASCRDFYFREVAPRLDGELQPMFMPVNR